MDENVNFDINESLKLYLTDPKSIPTPEADSELVYCEDDPESLTLPLINSALNPIVESIASNTDGVIKSSSFDTLQFLLKCAPSSISCRRHPDAATAGGPGEPEAELYLLSRTSSLLPAHALSKILDLLVSGLSSEADAVLHDLESDEQDVLQHHKQILEMYGFLLQWAISAVETKAAEHSTTSGTARKGPKGSKPKTSSKDGIWDSTGQIHVAMDTMCKVMKLRLNKLFTTTSERDTFVNLFTRSVYLIMESEARIKATATRMFCFKVLCVAVKHHGHSFGAQTSIVQNLTYFEHLAEPMAEFLHILAEQYDYPQLAGETMRELTNRDFSPSDTKGPKSISLFLTKLSEREPRLVIKEMGLLAKFLDSEAYSLRCAVIEVCGNLIADLSKQEERGENYKVQINAFFDTLEQRFLDINPYCRCRAIQVYVKLCDLEQKFPKRRQAITELAVQSLQDKSSNVRRNAVKLLGKLVSTHPFGLMHGEQLSHSDWSTRLDVVETELNALKPPPASPGLAETADGQAKVDSDLLDDATQLESKNPEMAMTEEQKAAAIQKVQEEAATSEAIGKLQLTKKYYTEALRFVNSLHEASETVCQLLSAKNKSEVIEAMDFFVVVDAYKVEMARIGIRKMLRLIWTKGNSDEGKGVQGHLIDCYRGLFFDAPQSFNANDAANFIARNMISLTFGASPAELTSLEQLLSTMVKAGSVSDSVISKLWQVYGVQKDISAAQRRGAIIVLGMIALADPEIVVKETETMMRIGLGHYGRSDLQLARFTCIALKRMIPAAKKAQEKTAAAGISRMSNDKAVLSKLAALILVPSKSQDWFGMAEQAIAAIYVLSKHPDVLCSEILRHKTRIVFQSARKTSSVSGTASPDSSVLDGETKAPLSDKEPSTDEHQQKPSTVLSQLLFAVGHMAIKQIVHLELCELDFKRRKQEQEKSKPAATTNPSPRKSAGPGGSRRRKTAVEEAEPQVERVGKRVEEEKDELDMIGGTTEDDFTEAISHIRERELLYGPNSLLAQFGPLVTEICANNAAYKDRQLQESATLCLAKLMCVSAEYCERNLPLLITILERSDDAIVRSNVVIALGDMAVCFNRLIDENTDFLYRRLNDVDGSVKRTCLMTLTFLILAGQVKVKGQLGEMAKCVEDGDRKIADLARMFFTELATKDNAVYNHFVDMFGLLSGDQERGRGLDDDAFKRILRFLVGFIEKDRHSRALAEKLAARLPRAESERQWKDIAFAIGLLQQQQQQHGGGGGGSSSSRTEAANRDGGGGVAGGRGGGHHAANEEISQLLAAGFRHVTVDDGTNGANSGGANDKEDEVDSGGGDVDAGGVGETTTMETTTTTMTTLGLENDVTIGA